MNKVEEDHETIVYITPAEVMALTENSHLDIHNSNEAMQVVDHLAVTNDGIVDGPKDFRSADVYQAARSQDQSSPTPDPDVNVPGFEKGPGPFYRVPYLHEIIFHPTQALDITAESPLTPLLNRSQYYDHVLTTAKSRMAFLGKSNDLDAIGDNSDKTDGLIARFESMKTDLATVSKKLDLVHDNVNKILKATLDILHQLDIDAKAEEEAIIADFDDYDVEVLWDPQGWFGEAGDVKERFPTGIKAGRGGGQGGFCAVM